jgi:hypothetical protein
MMGHLLHLDAAPLVMLSLRGFCGNGVQCRTPPILSTNASRMRSVHS